MQREMLIRGEKGKVSKVAEDENLDAGKTRKVTLRRKKGGEMA